MTFDDPAILAIGGAVFDRPYEHRSRALTTGMER